MSLAEEILKELRELKEAIKGREKKEKNDLDLGELGEVDLKEWFIEGVGAGLEGVASEFVRQYIDLGDWTGLAAGYVVAKFLAPRISPALATIGRGMAVASIGKVVSNYARGWFGKKTTTKTELEELLGVTG